MVCFRCFITSLSKHFIVTGVSAMGAIVIEAGYSSGLWHRNDGGCLEARWYSGLGQRGVKYVRQDLRQLVSAVLQNPTWDSIRT